MSGKIAVGTRLYSGSSCEDPELKGFTKIICLTTSTAYGSLGPYCLKHDGIILENEWQFSKIYPFVRPSRQHFSRFDNRIIWEHIPEHGSKEVHIDENGFITVDYLKWRLKGFMCSEAVRYPPGKPYMRECAGSILQKDLNKLFSDNPPVRPRIELPCQATKSSVFSSPSVPSIERKESSLPLVECKELSLHSTNNVIRLLNYIEARKEIYVPEYCAAVVEAKQFKELKERLSKGENLLIVEVDGPHQEDLKYYMEKYRVDSHFIENNTMLATKDNLKIMLNDTKHPYGHGYCLAMALLGISVKDLE